MMGGLGKGLGALLSDEGKMTSRTPGIRKSLKEKEKDLRTIKEEIEEKKRKVEELRKKLTIELMLKGKVDKSELFEKEEELKLLFDKREKLELEIEDLARDISSKVDIPSVPSEEKGTHPEKMDQLGSEIDMTMVKDLMFDDEPIPGLEDRKPASTGNEPSQPDNGEGSMVDKSFAGEDGDDQHITELKEELSGPREAMRVEQESMGSDIPRAEVLQSPESEAPEQGPPVRKVDETRELQAARPIVRRRIAPKKVKVVRTKKKVERKKDRGLFEIIEKAQYLLARNEPETAKRILHSALREYPLDDDLLYHLGNAFFMEGDLDSAEIRYRKSTEINPRSYRAFNNLGVVLKKKGERESAIQAFNQSLEINDSYDRAWFNLGSIFMEIDPPMFNEAKIFLRRALECNPRMEQAREKLDKCLRELDRGT